MKSLKILGHLVSFAVVAFIGIKALNTACFNSFDVNLSLIALIFALVCDLVSLIFDRAFIALLDSWGKDKRKHDIARVKI